MEVLLQSLVDLDIKDEKGRTALDLAAFKGHAECVEALISQGASVTVKDNITKRTPLHASGERALLPCLWPLLSFSSSLSFPRSFFLSVTTYSLRCAMFPLLMVLQPKNQGKREHLPHCFSWGRMVENTGMLSLVMKLSWGSKHSTFCKGNTAEIHPLSDIILFLS